MRMHYIVTLYARVHDLYCLCYGRILYIGVHSTFATQNKD
jgi:hypothetical protein